MLPSDPGNQVIGTESLLDVLTKRETDPVKALQRQKRREYTQRASWTETVIFAKQQRKLRNMLEARDRKGKKHDFSGSSGGGGFERTRKQRSQKPDLFRWRTWGVSDTPEWKMWREYRQNRMKKQSATSLVRVVSGPFGPLMGASIDEVWASGDMLPISLGMTTSSGGGSGRRGSFVDGLGASRRSSFSGSHDNAQGGSSAGAQPTSSNSGTPPRQLSDRRHGRRKGVGGAEGAGASDPTTRNKNNNSSNSDGNSNNDNNTNNDNNNNNNSNSLTEGRGTTWNRRKQYADALIERKRAQKLSMINGGRNGRVTGNDPHKRHVQRMRDASTRLARENRKWSQRLSRYRSNISLYDSDGGNHMSGSAKLLGGKSFDERKTGLSGEHSGRSGATATHHVFHRVCSVKDRSRLVSLRFRNKDASSRDRSFLASAGGEGEETLSTVRRVFEMIAGPSANKISKSVFRETLALESVPHFAERIWAAFHSRIGSLLELADFQSTLAIIMPPLSPGSRGSSVSRPGTRPSSSSGKAGSPSADAVMRAHFCFHLYDLSGNGTYIDSKDLFRLLRWGVDKVFPQDFVIMSDYLRDGSENSSNTRKLTFATFVRLNAHRPNFELTEYVYQRLYRQFRVKLKSRRGARDRGSRAVSRESVPPTASASSSRRPSYSGGLDGDSAHGTAGGPGVSPIVRDLQVILNMRNSRRSSMSRPRSTAAADTSSVVSAAAGTEQSMGVGGARGSRGGARGASTLSRSFKPHDPADFQEMLKLQYCLEYRFLDALVEPVDAATVQGYLRFIEQFLNATIDLEQGEGDAPSSPRSKSTSTSNDPSGARNAGKKSSGEGGSNKSTAGLRRRPSLSRRSTEVIRGIPDHVTLRLRQELREYKEELDSVCFMGNELHPVCVATRQYRVRLLTCEDVCRLLGEMPSSYASFSFFRVMMLGYLRAPFVVRMEQCMQWIMTSAGRDPRAMSLLADSTTDGKLALSLDPAEVEDSVQHRAGHHHPQRSEAWRVHSGVGGEVGVGDLVSPPSVGGWDARVWDVNHMHPLEVLLGRSSEFMQIGWGRTGSFMRSSGAVSAASRAHSEPFHTLPTSAAGEHHHLRRAPSGAKPMARPSGLVGAVEESPLPVGEEPVLVPPFAGGRRRSNGADPQGPPPVATDLLEVTMEGELLRLESKDGSDDDALPVSAAGSSSPRKLAMESEGFVVADDVLPTSAAVSTVHMGRSPPSRFRRSETGPSFSPALSSAASIGSGTGGGDRFDHYREARQERKRVPKGMWRDLQEGVISFLFGALFLKQELQCKRQELLRREQLQLQRQKAEESSNASTETFSIVAEEGESAADESAGDESRSQNGGGGSGSGGVGGADVRHDEQTGSNTAGNAGMDGMTPADAGQALERASTMLSRPTGAAAAAGKSGAGAGGRLHVSRHPPPRAMTMTSAVATKPKSMVNHSQYFQNCNLTSFRAKPCVYGVCDARILACGVAHLLSRSYEGQFHMLFDLLDLDGDKTLAARDLSDVLGSHEFSKVAYLSMDMRPVLSVLESKFELPLSGDMSGGAVDVRRGKKKGARVANHELPPRWFHHRVAALKGNTGLSSGGGGAATGDRVVDMNERRRALHRKKEEAVLLAEFSSFINYLEFRASYSSPPYFLRALLRNV